MGRPTDLFLSFISPTRIYIVFPSMFCPKNVYIKCAIYLELWGIFSAGQAAA